MATSDNTIYQPLLAMAELIRSGGTRGYKKDYHSSMVVPKKIAERPRAEAERK